MIKKLYRKLYYKLTGRYKWGWMMFLSDFPPKPLENKTVIPVDYNKLFENVCQKSDYIDPMRHFRRSKK